MKGVVKEISFFSRAAASFPHSTVRKKSHLHGIDTYDSTQDKVGSSMVYVPVINIYMHVSGVPERRTVNSFKPPPGALLSIPYSMSGVPHFINIAS